MQIDATHLTSANASLPLIGIVMGSKNDWPTMREAAQILEFFGVQFEARVVSAHRTPALLHEYASSAVSRGLKLLIAGAGGAAHLPGMLAAISRLPVLGVPIVSKAFHGVDSLLSILQMPRGVPVLTLGLGPVGAANAALSAIAILALQDSLLAAKLDAFRQAQTDEVLCNADPRVQG